MTVRHHAAAVMALLCLAAPAAAQEPVEPAAPDRFGAVVGADEFQRSCAPCHGTGGRGDGPVADYAGTRFPDLTQLAAGNEGIFPFVRVFRTVEGRADVPGHGGRLMPVWGQRYMVEGTLEDVPLTDETRRQIVLGRIVQVVNYLQSIQDPMGDTRPLLEEAE